MTRISFIVPTYNRARFLVEALQSILPQMSEKDEIVVIDDGSTDDTAAVIRGFGKHVRYVRQENSGKSAALNRAMAMTDGEYVWICDDDDLLRPGAVDLMLAALHGSDLGFVFGRYSRFSDDASGRRTDLGTGYWPDLSRGSLVRHVLEDAFVMQNAALVRRRSYDAAGPFDENMLRSLDYEMFVRLALVVPAAYVDAIVFDQRKHEGSRGPARELHAAVDANRVWIEYDRRIFERVRTAVPVALYEGMFESGDRQLLRRAALLQRAAMLARHHMWREAVADLEFASRLAGDIALTAVEREICARVLGGKHGFHGALVPETCERLRALHRQPLGRTIVRAVLSGALWRVRRGGTEERRKTRRLLVRVAGFSGVAKLLLARAMPPRRRRGPLRLRERDVLPRDLLMPDDPLRR